MAALGGQQTHSVHIITEEERNVYFRDFALVDKDGTGWIESEEIATLLEALIQHSAHRIFPSLAVRIRIGITDTYTYVYCYRTSYNLTIVLSVNSSLTTVSQAQLGRAPTEKEIKYVTNRFDRDHDGRISFEEYISMICGGEWTVSGPSVFAGHGHHGDDNSAELPEECKSLFDEIVEKVNCVTLEDLEEMRQLQDPTGAVRDLFEVLLSLLGQQHTDWEHAKIHLAHPKVMLKNLKGMPLVILHDHAPYENFERGRLLAAKIGELLPGGLDSWPVMVCPLWNITKSSQAARDLAIFCLKCIKLYDLLYLRCDTTDRPELIQLHRTASLKEDLTPPELPQRLKNALAACQHIKKVDTVRLESSVRPPSELASSILGTTLMLLGHAHSKDEVAWQGCRHLLKHHHQMVDHMRSLSNMTTEGDALPAGFLLTDPIIGKWTSEDYPTEEAFLKEGVAKTDNCRTLLPMAEWCLALHAAWRVSRGRQGDLGH